MARFPLQFSAQDQQGKTMVGATVTVTLTGTDTTIISYSASTGGTDDGGVYTTDVNGYVKLFIDETDYSALQYFRVTITANSFKTRVIDDVLVFPATSADSAASSAAASAAAALVSENNAAADEALTDADATATAADVVSTNADVVSTGNDVTATNADVVLTNADVVLTGNDVTSTNADVVSTGNDVTSTGNDVTSTGNDVTSTNADVVSTNADVVTTTGQVSAVAYSYTFSSNTAMAIPGAGFCRFNHATLGSVTAIAFDALSGEAGNPDVSDFLASLDDSSNTTHYGHIQVRLRDTPATYVVFDITGAVVDNGGWLQFAVTFNSSNGTISNADNLYFGFTRTGDVGSGLSDVVFDVTPQLGGNLDVNGKKITSPDATDSIEIVNGTINIDMNSGNIIDITDSGMRIGAGGARIVSVLDEDSFASNSSVHLASQQSIKSYVDTEITGASGWDLIATQTASADATIDFTTGIDSTYDNYMILLSDVIPATDAQIMHVQVSTGASWNVGASDYEDAFLTGFSGGTHGGNGVIGAAYMRISDTTLGTAGGESLNGVLFFTNLAKTTLSWFTGTIYCLNSGPNTGTSSVGGRFLTAEANDGLRFFFASGNITSGVFKLYGMRV